MDRVDAYMFNVDHGDSTILRLQSDSAPPRWVLIDSNVVRRNGKLVNPAHEFLLRNKVPRLDLVVITHLHADHYNGLDRIIADVPISKFAIPPFLSQKSSTIRNESLLKYKRKILDAIATSGGDPSIGGPMLALASLLNLIHQEPELFEEAAGPESLLRIAGLEDPQIKVYLPMRAVKGVLMQRIKDDDFELDLFPSMNDSSVVVLLEVHGQKLLWGADSTLMQWMEHRHRMKRDGVESLEATVVKVPHHASKHNSELWLYEYLLGTTLRGKTLLVSANGRSHPHDEFFQLVANTGMTVYCTNLAEKCGADTYASLSHLAQAPRGARPFLLNYGVHKQPIPCQGDITVTIDSSGLQVANSTGMACVYSALTPRLRRAVP